MELYKKDEIITCSDYIKVPLEIVGNQKYNLDSTSILAYSLLLEKYAQGLFDIEFCATDTSLEAIQQELGISRSTAVLVLKKLEKAGLLRNIPA